MLEVGVGKKKKKKVKNGCQKRKVPKQQEKPKHAQFLAAYPKPLKFAPGYTDFQGKTFYKRLDMLIAHQKKKKKDVNTTFFFFFFNKQALGH